VNDFARVSWARRTSRLVPDPGAQTLAGVSGLLLRRRWPGQPLYLIMDNYGPRQRPEVLAWCEAQDPELGVHSHQRVVAELDRV
jgi:hypothetical protein